jgi:hypothetical protein
MAGFDAPADIFKHMDELIRIVSDNRRYRFLLRQVWYRMRPIVADRTGKSLGYNYFSQKLFTGYERKFGDEPLAIRDERGRFYVPHIGESFSPGTMSVEGYKRHALRYKHIMFIEK